VLSRFQCPPETVLELKADEYGVVGSLSASKTHDRTAIILGLLPSEPPGMTVYDILEQWPSDLKPGRRTLLDDIGPMLTSQKITRTGSGVKHDPFRFLSGTYSI
jgi:hypothetical protein